MLFKISRIKSLRDEGRDHKLILASDVLVIYETTITNFTLASPFLHFWQDFRDYFLGLLKLFSFFFDEGTDILDIHVLDDRGGNLFLGFYIWLFTNFKLFLLAKAFTIFAVFFLDHHKFSFGQRSDFDPGSPLLRLKISSLLGSNLACRFFLNLVGYFDVFSLLATRFTL